MSIYLLPIQTAILLFPLLAALITIPFSIVQYRRYGSLPFTRVLIVYSFVFYLLCACFLVILPLPPIEEVAQYTSPIIQLTPFECLREFSLSTSLVLSDPTTYWAALNEPSLFLIIFNLLLTLPFGIFLRYYFKCSWKKTMLFSFLLSLSFECLQLSALFGIYPRPYRVFDVDDLITNTLGGMLGFALTPLVSRFLPSREKIDELSFHQGKQVSPLRRITAFLIDLFIIAVLCIVLLAILFIGNIVSSSSFIRVMILVYSSVVCLYAILIPIVSKGKTPGKSLVNIRLVQQENQSISWVHSILHFGVLYLLILPSPYLLFLSLVHYFNYQGYFSLDLLWIAILIVFLVFSIIQSLRSLFHKNCYPWYDKKCKLHNISTIQVEQDSD